MIFVVLLAHGICQPVADYIFLQKSVFLGEVLSSQVEETSEKKEVVRLSFVERVRCR